MLIPLLLGLASAGPAAQLTAPQLTVVGGGPIGQPLIYAATGMTSLPPIPELLLIDAAINTPPLPLPTFGDLYLAGSPALLSLPGNGTFTWTVPVPSDPILVGATLHAQALGLVFDGFEGELKLSTLASVSLSGEPGISRFAAVANIGDGTISFLGLGDDETRMVGYEFTGSLPEALGAAPDGQHLYVADVGAGAVRTFAIDQDAGRWTPLGTVPAGSGPGAIAVSPNGSNLYVANASSNDISQYSVDAQGMPQPLTPATVAGGLRPTALAMRPMGSWLFAAAGNSGQVGAYALTPGSGALALDDSVFVGGNPSDLVSNPAGDRVHVLLRSAGTIRTLAFDATAGGFAGVVGSDIAVGTGATSIALDPDGRWLFVSDAAGSTVEQYDIDPSTGAVLTGTTSSTITGLGPIRLRVDSAGERLMVLCAAINEVWIYALDPASGEPSFAQRLRQRSTPSDIVFLDGEARIDFTSRLLVAGHRDSNEVRRYQFDADSGTLIDLGGGFSSTGASPRGIGLDRESGLTALANFTGQSLSAFELNVENGNLAPLGETASVSSPFDVAVDPAGRFIWASEAGGNAVATFDVGQGATPVLTSSVSMPPSSIPRGIAVDPTGQFVVATGSLTDLVHVYRASPVDGSLQPVGAVAVNGAPYDLVFHPEGRFVYVLTRSNKKVRAVTLDPVTGVPTLLAGINVATGAAPEALAVDPAGRFLYCANSGDDSISAYRVEAITGQLTPANGSPVADDPRGIVVDSSGSTLVVANTSAHLLQAFSIDQATGDLTFLAMFASNGLGPLGLAVTNEFD